jgi:hypothetical protein
MRYNKAMNEKQVQVEAILSLLDAKSVAQYIPEAVLSRIKKYDSNPVFAMMTVGYEGESTGDLYNGNKEKLGKDQWYKQLWPIKAVKQLVSKLTEKEIPIYAHQHDVTGEKNRSKLGYIVAGTKKVINAVTHALGIAYITDIPTRAQLQNGELNACSMEARCLFVEAPNSLNWVVESVKEVLGVVLFNREVVEPGFKNANILAVVTAMSADGKERNNERMEVTLEDVRKYIETNKVIPSTLFSVETLTKDPRVKDILQNDIAVAVQKKDDEIKALNLELVPLKKAQAMSTLGEMVEKSELLKEEPKKLVEYLKKIIRIDGNTVDQVTVDKEIKLQLGVVKDLGIKFDDTSKNTNDKKVDSNNKDTKKTSNATDDNGGEDQPNPNKVESYLTPETNPLIPK